MLSKDLKNKDTILAALTSLGSDDLKAIKAAAGALLGEKGTVGSPYDRTGYEPWLREAVKAITGQGIRDNDRVFNKNAVIAIEFLQTNFAEALTNKTVALALMRYLLRLLVDNLQAMKIPVTRNTLVQHLHRLDDVFNDAFPGYANDKAAKLILAAITH